MPFVDIIARKRDGRALSREDIDTFVSGVTSGAIPDYQASALLMAIVIKGMNAEETGWLAGAMARSGERVDLSDVPGFKVGKHSTGGVGDKVSIVLAPVAAACGVVVPKMSGRGLGHTGGTLDKLESIPGYRIDLTIEEFKQVLREVGTSIIGQTSALAPADKKLYALRDVTATVPSIPLISASIMSKKLAEGSSALVLDVKCGDGAFMKDLEDARALAVSMVAIGTQAGVRTEAVLTDMSAPLGRAVGNTLEIIECLETLKGTGPTELTGVIRVLARRMVMLAGVDSRRDRRGSSRGRCDVFGSGVAGLREVDREAGWQCANRGRLLAAAVGAGLRAAARDARRIHHGDARRSCRPRVARAGSRAESSRRRGRSWRGDRRDEPTWGFSEGGRYTARAASQRRTQSGGGAGVVSRSDFHWGRAACSPTEGTGRGAMRDGKPVRAA